MGRNARRRAEEVLSEKRILGLQIATCERLLARHAPDALARVQATTNAEVATVPTLSHQFV